MSALFPTEGVWRCSEYSVTQTDHKAKGYDLKRCVVGRFFQAFQTVVLSDVLEFELKDMAPSLYMILSLFSDKNFD